MTNTDFKCSHTHLHFVLIQNSSPAIFMHLVLPEGSSLPGHPNAFCPQHKSHQYAVTWTARLLHLKNSWWWKLSSARLMYGKVLVYFLISELQAAATHTLSAAWWGRRGTLAFLYFTLHTTSTRKKKKKKTKCILLGGKGKRKAKKKPAVKTLDKKRPKCTPWLAVILWL